MKDGEFFGMKYPFKECARPALLKEKLCLDCSVRRFCEAPEKDASRTSPMEVMHMQ